jgi:hypothetical protein
MEPRQCRDFDAAHALGLSHSQPTDHSLYEFQRRFQGLVNGSRGGGSVKRNKPGGAKKSRDGHPQVVDT